MNSLFENEDYKFEDMESLISNQIEESIHLDFKSGEALSRNPSKKKEISKDIASFANSDGGIIIYGIKEENHVAESFSFVNGNDFTKEWLEQVINTTVNRRIEDLLIFPIRKDNDILKTIYLVKIPRSRDTPHMSQDKRFYKRFNFQSVMMEEYEVRQLYGRKIKSELVLYSWSIGQIDNDSQDEYKFKCTVQIFNSGDVSEKDFKVNVIFDNYDSRAEISWPQSSVNLDFTVLNPNCIKLSAESKSSIFPKETVSVMRFDMSVPKSDIKEILSSTNIRVYLFYQNGEGILETNFTEIIKKTENQD